MDIGQTFRDSQDYDFLQPYADGEGLVAGYRIEGLLLRDPWRHTTYEATAHDGRRVALKFLRLRSGAGRREAKRVRQRIRARASVEHPHLLPIFDFGKLDDLYYVASGLCKAPTLADLLKAGPLRTKSCLRLLGQVADALETAHRQGVIHRDLAPENVLDTPTGGGHVMLGDFGAANPERGRGLLDFALSSSHTSPEELRDEPLTPASNVYSLACILVECLSGSPPYASELPGMVAYAHAIEPPPRLSERRPELPPELDDLVASAMAKDPKERLRSPRDLVAAAAASLGLDSPIPVVVHGDQISRANGLPAEASSDQNPPAPQKRAARTARVPRSALAQKAPALQEMAAHAAAVSRNALVLALVVVVVLSGVLGFILARSGDDAPQADRAAATDTARLRAARQGTADLRATDVVLERLNGDRASLRRRLAAARTRRAQSAAALGLSSAYRVAARAVPKGSRDTARIASILDDVAQAYGRLALSTRRGKRRGHVTARRAVRRGESDLQQASVRLSRPQRQR